MKVLLYATSKEVIRNLSNFLSERENGFAVITCQTFDKLHEHLQYIYSFTAVILRVANKEELLELLTIQEILKNSKNVLQLPDSSKTLLQQALKLFPRYITETERDFEEISVVLRKLYALPLTRLS